MTSFVRSTALEIVKGIHLTSKGYLYPDWSQVFHSRTQSNLNSRHMLYNIMECPIIKSSLMLHMYRGYRAQLLYYIPVNACL